MHARELPFLRRAAGALAAGLTAALLLAGCAGPFGGGGSSSSEGGTAGMPEPMPADSSGEIAQAEAADRSVITTGWMTVTVDDPLGTVPEVLEIVDRADGRIDSRSVQPATDNQEARAMLTLRVPSDELDGVLDELSALGEVNSVEISATDVTLQVTDLEARIAVLRSSIERLTALLGQAASTADLIALETAISERQAELDSLVSQLEYLDDQVQMSTVSLTLVSPGEVAPGAPKTFWDGIVAGWEALLAALSGAVIGLGVALPWLLALALLGGVVALIVTLIIRSANRRAARKQTGS